MQVPELVMQANFRFRGADALDRDLQGAAGLLFATVGGLTACGHRQDERVHRAKQGGELLSVSAAPCQGSSEQGEGGGGFAFNLHAKP